MSEIRGADPVYDGAVAMSMVPTAFPGNFGGTTVSFGDGINYFIPKGIFKDLRVGLELERPLLQDLNGVQMEIDYILSAGLQSKLNFSDHWIATRQ